MILKVLVNFIVAVLVITNLVDSDDHSILIVNNLFLQIIPGTTKDNDDNDGSNYDHGSGSDVGVDDNKVSTDCKYLNTIRANYTICCQYPAIVIWTWIYQACLVECIKKIIASKDTDRLKFAFIDRVELLKASIMKTGL